MIAFLGWLRGELAEMWCLATNRHRFVRDGGIHVCARCPLWFVELEVWDGASFRRERLYKRGAR